jgi:hypothetical protein
MILFAVANISVVKPDKARKIEDTLIMNAQRGAFGGQISEEQLIQMLESLTEKTKAATKVHVVLHLKQMSCVYFCMNHWSHLKLVIEFR